MNVCNDVDEIQSLDDHKNVFTFSTQEMTKLTILYFKSIVKISKVTWWSSEIVCKPFSPVFWKIFPSKSLVLRQSQRPIQQTLSLSLTHTQAHTNTHTLKERDRERASKAVCENCYRVSENKKMCREGGKRGGGG